MGQECGAIGTRTRDTGQSKSIQKVAATWPFFYSSCVRLVRFYFVFALPSPSYPAPTLPPRRAETYKQRRKFAIKAKVHIELECFAFYVA